MEKIFAWVIGPVLAVVFGLLSVSSFMSWEQTHNSSRVISMFIDLQRFLVGLVGGPITGVLFAVAAVSILWVAFTQKPQRKQG